MFPGYIYTKAQIGEKEPMNKRQKKKRAKNTILIIGHYIYLKPKEQTMFAKMKPKEQMAFIAEKIDKQSK